MTTHLQQRAWSFKGPQQQHAKRNEAKPNETAPNENTSGHAPPQGPREPHTCYGGLSPDMKTCQTNPPPPIEMTMPPPNENHKYDWPRNTHQTKPGNRNTQHKTMEPPDKPHPLRQVVI
ncbi:hypothetical protein BS47DRAFT_1362470 [Hydnum rufescens UP504]|uniref:Uncharacterized protein n=1 Tax=Hydnum rufescens UP504 TaxID=1448309 RepID=A0A9P6DX10_9AGAM|nr:hypothetical protein BS47DRAFT_1362470 [Hydnum rufescens UP504]